MLVEIPNILGMNLKPNAAAPVILSWPLLRYEAFLVKVVHLSPVVARAYALLGPPSSVNGKVNTLTRCETTRRLQRTTGRRHPSSTRSAPPLSASYGWTWTEFPVCRPHPPQALLFIPQTLLRPQQCFEMQQSMFLWLFRTSMVRAAEQPIDPQTLPS